MQGRRIIGIHIEHHWGVPTSLLHAAHGLQSLCRIHGSGTAPQQQHRIKKICRFLPSKSKTPTVFPSRQSRYPLRWEEYHHLRCCPLPPRGASCFTVQILRFSSLGQRKHLNLPSCRAELVPGPCSHPVFGPQPLRFGNTMSAQQSAPLGAPQTQPCRSLSATRSSTASWHRGGKIPPTPAESGMSKKQQNFSILFGGERRRSGRRPAFLLGFFLPLSHSPDKNKAQSGRHSVHLTGRRHLQTVLPKAIVLQRCNFSFSASVRQILFLILSKQIPFPCPVTV